MPATAECPHCGKAHRLAGWEEAVAKCLARAEKRAAREQAKADDLEARLRYAKEHPLEDFLVAWIHNHTRIKGGRWETAGLSGAVADVKRHYPAPADWPHRCREERCLLCTPVTKASIKTKGGAVVGFELKEQPRQWDAATVVYVDTWRLNWGAAA